MKWASDSFVFFVREKFVLIVVGMRFEQMKYTIVETSPPITCSTHLVKLISPYFC